VEVGQGLAQRRGDPLLMSRVAEREEKADRHGLRAGASQPIDQTTDLVLGQLLDHALGSPLRRLEAQHGIDQRTGLGAAGVIEAGTLLTADLEEVGEAARRDQSRARAALLQQRVRADRHAMCERLDVVGFGLGVPQYLLDGPDHAAGLVGGRARHLRRVEHVAVEQRGVGEGSTDVDAEQHGANLPGVCAGPDPPGGPAHTAPGKPRLPPPPAPNGLRLGFRLPAPSHHSR
jgi:hypothetical protein